MALLSSWGCAVHRRHVPFSGRSPPGKSLVVRPSTKATGGLGHHTRSWRGSKPLLFLTCVLTFGIYYHYTRARIDAVEFPDWILVCMSANLPFYLESHAYGTLSQVDRGISLYILTMLQKDSCMISLMINLLACLFVFVAGSVRAVAFCAMLARQRAGYA